MWVGGFGGGLVTGGFDWCFWSHSRDVYLAVSIFVARG